MRITSTDFLKTNGKIKTVIGVSLPTFRVRLKIGGSVYTDAFNIEEPFDVKTHVFYVPESELKGETDALLLYRAFKKGKKDLQKKLVLRPERFADGNELLSQYDNGVTVKEEKTEELYEGVTYTEFTCEDKNGAPVIFSLVKTDLKNSSLYIGTPDDGYENRKVKATIPDMTAAAEKNGKNVLAAVNADFFDIFGDCHPSGLCVKNGRVIANENSPRPFVGIKKDGSAVLTDLKESPDILNSLFQAAAGLQMIVKDGKIFDYAPLEPFSYVRHPRTAAGITENGEVLLLEVDGRIPDHSNGASLVDLALFMIKLGARRAVNLDGGGSSAVYTKKGGEHILRTVPADLFFPNDKLIRKDYNAILVTAGKIGE